MLKITKKNELVLIPTTKLSDFFKVSDKHIKDLEAELITQINGIISTIFILSDYDLKSDLTKRLFKIPNEKKGKYLKYYQKYKTLNHENIIKIYGLYKKFDNLYIVTESYESTSFIKYFRNRTGSNTEFINCIKEIYNALVYFRKHFPFPVLLSTSLLDYSQKKVKIIPSFLKVHDFHVLAPEEL